MAKKEKTKKKKGLWIYDLIIVVLIAVIAYSGYRFFSERQVLAQSANTYSAVTQKYAQILTYQEDMVKINGIEKRLPLQLIDFAGLLAENKETAAWLFCDDSVINYPVMQTTDNDYYLHHLFSGEVNACGTLFVDCDNKPDFSDQNIIIYGHFMKNQQMFYSLKYYDDQEYFEEHPVMLLYTPEKTYRIEIFSSCILDGTNGIPLNFAMESDYQEWITSLYNKSNIKSDVEMTTKDQMVTLYTCAYTFENAKRLVFGKLVPLEIPG